MNALAIVDRLPRWIMAGIVLAMIAILVVGTSYYRESRDRAELVAEQNLTSIARLKVFSIQEWCHETLDDADHVAREPGLKGLLAPGAAVPSAARSNEAAAILSLPLMHQHYRTARLVNAAGGVLVDGGHASDHLEAAEIDAVRTALLTGEPVMSQVAIDAAQGPRLGVAAPVVGVMDGDDSASHAVLLGIDPEDYLYTLIEMMPLRSRSMETVLFRREGENVRILNTVRFQTDTTLRLNIPLAQTNVSYVMGATGSRGVVRAVDYRGVPVLSCLISVPDSPWLLSSEVDLEEIFGDWNKRARLIVATIALTLLGLAISGLAVWQWSKRSSFERLYRAEAGLRASEARSGAILHSIGDAIVTADTDSVVTQLNPVAEALTGWTAAEARGRWMSDIFRLVDENDGRALPCKAPAVLRNGESQAIADRALLVARDGTKRPVSGSVSAIREGAGVIAGVVLVFRDETRNREEQRALTDVVGKLHEAQQVAHMGAWEVEWTAGRMTASPEFFRIYELAPQPGGHISPEEVIDRHHPEDREEVKRRIENDASYTVQFRAQFPDGRVKHLELRGITEFAPDGTRIRAAGTTQDVTGRVLADQALRESEKRLRLLAENSTDLIFLLELTTGRYLYGSPAVERMLGYTPDEFVTKVIDELVAPEARAGVHEHIAQRVAAFAAGDASARDVTLELPLVRKDGSVFVAEISTSLRLDGRGQPTQAQGAVRDITERIKAEQEVLKTRAQLEETNRLLEQRVEERTRQLAEARQQLLRVLDSMNDVFFALDTEWRFVVLNTRAEEHFGGSKRNMIGRSFWEAVPVAAGTPIERLMREAMRDQKPAATETASAVKPGTFISLHVYPTPTELSVFASDVTTRKRAEEETLKLSRIIEQTPFPVMLADMDANLVYTNAAFTAVTGYPQAEALGRNPRFLQSGAHRPEFYQRMWATLTSGQAWRGEFCNRRKNGEIYWEAATIVPVRNSEGRVVNYAAVKEDITQAKRIAKDLVDAKEAAEVANRAKSEFLSNMSHELRTPLNAVIGFSEILADQTFGALNPKQTKYMENILHAGRHLLSLINDILDVSKVEAGKMKLAPQVLQVKKTVDEVMELTRGRAAKHNLRMTRTVPDDLHVAADERMFKQILFNLLSNAIKFTPEGGRVTVTAKPVGPDVRISVADTGIGISQENQKRLFQEFEQIDSSLSRKHQGTGLGLSLCRRFAALHGGRIWVESAGEGHGSTFHFTLPAEVDRIPKAEEQ